MQRKNVFIVGSDDFNLAQFRSLRRAQEYRFHPLFSFADIRGGQTIPVRRIMESVDARLRDFPERVDALVGYGDFPISTLLPILCRRHGLNGASLESVLKCEHKYWSRLEQARLIPDHVPRFAAVNPFAEDPLQGMELDYPFWLKPVKAVLSHLGFKIRDAHDFRESIQRVRRDIWRYAEPFNYLLGHARLPEPVAGVNGWHCIAEEIISTPRQCTVEGYVFRGEVEVYGIVDSLREGPYGSCFSRYQYPSCLPAGVQRRIAGLSKDVIRHIGYDNAPFNIEFFWDEDSDRLWLLEINPRLSKSHCPLFRMVDGDGHFAVLLDLALGRRPDFPRRRGDYRLAAKFMLREYRDARVTRVPSAEELQAIQQRIPGVMIQLEVEQDALLSQLIDQDSYSYETAVLFIGADDEAELVEKYDACLTALPLELEYLDE